jgi:hypothetical protein
MMFVIANLAVGMQVRRLNLAGRLANFYNYFWPSRFEKKALLLELAAEKMVAMAHGFGSHGVP